MGEAAAAARTIPQGRPFITPLHPTNLPALVSCALSAYAGSSTLLLQPSEGFGYSGRGVQGTIRGDPVQVEDANRCVKNIFPVHAPICSGIFHSL